MKIVCHGFDALRLLTTGAATETQRMGGGNGEFGIRNEGFVLHVGAEYIQPIYGNGFCYDVAAIRELSVMV